MQEQQGNLMPQLSGLPGPQPFKRGKSKMEDKKITSSNPMHDDGKPDMGKPVTASVDEIVAKTAEAIGAGKAFGGWTDKVDEEKNTVKRGATIKVKLGKGKPAGSYKEKVSGSDLKAAGDMFDRLRGKAKNEATDVSGTMARVRAIAKKQAQKAAKDTPLVKIGPDSTRKNPQYTKTIRPSDLKKKVNEGILSTVGKFAVSTGKNAAKDAVKQRATEIAYTGIKKATSRKKNQSSVNTPNKNLSTNEKMRRHMDGVHEGSW